MKFTFYYKEKTLLIILLLLAIGFATVTTILNINSTVGLLSDNENFDVYFSGALLDGVDKSNIYIKDKKHIIYKTNDLMKAGDISELEYEVTNGSNQYDADVTISCTPTTTKYYSVTPVPNELAVEAGKVETGKIKVELLKYSTEIIEETIECELIANAVERTTTGDDVDLNKTYQITGTLKDKDDNVLANQPLIVFSETLHETVTDDYGFFYVNNLERGEHEIFIVDSNVSGKTKEEIKTNYLDKSTISTNNNRISFSEYIVEDFNVEPQTNNKVTIHFDADGGIITNDTIVVDQYSKILDLEIPEDSNVLSTFKGWYLDTKEITTNTIIRSDSTLKAKWDLKQIKIDFLKDRYPLSVEYGKYSYSNDNLVFTYSTTNSYNNGTRIIYENPVSTGYIRIKGNVKVNSSSTNKYASLKIMLGTSRRGQNIAILDALTNLTPGSNENFDYIFPIERNNTYLTLGMGRSNTSVSGSLGGTLTITDFCLYE